MNIELFYVVGRKFDTHHILLPAFSNRTTAEEVVRVAEKLVEEATRKPLTEKERGYIVIYTLSEMEADDKMCSACINSARSEIQLLKSLMN